MKKIVINLSLSVFVFVLCLGLVEIFFALNARHHWIRPLQLTLPASPVTHVQGKPIPQSVLADVERKFKDFQRPNEELAEGDEIYRPSNHQINTPMWVSRYIQLFRQNTEPIEIFKNKMVNTTYKKVFYDVTYEMDEKARRRLPHQEISKYKPNMLFIGCSYTFGYGTNNNETMPYFMKHSYPEYNVYNLGIPGGGLNDMLDDAIAANRMADMNDLGGVAIYTFIYDHLERTLCSLNCYREERKSWVPVKSHYDFTSDGKLVNYGPQIVSRPYRSKLYALLAKSAFLDFVGFEKSDDFSSEDEEKFARMTAELQKIYNKRGYDFYIYVLSMGSALPKSLAKQFDNYNLKYTGYDISSLDPWVERGKIVGDGHLNELGNYVLAKQIHQMLLDTPPKFPVKAEEDK